MTDDFVVVKPQAMRDMAAALRQCLCAQRRETGGAIALVQVEVCVRAGKCTCPAKAALQSAEGR